MICKECGKQMPNDAKFCLECGAKIEQSDDDIKTKIKKMQEEWEKIDKENEINGRVFHIVGKKMVLSPDDIFFKEIPVGIYKIYALEIKRYELNYSKEVTSFKALMDQMQTVKETFLKIAGRFSYLAKKVNVECNEENLLEYYVVVNGNSLDLSSVNAIYECYKSYEELQKQFDNISNLLELEKASRNKVIGIGHGISGLLVSSIQAGIVNAGIGSIYDIKNNATKRSLEKKMQKTLDEFATNSQVRDKIYECFERDIDKLVEAFISLLVEKTGREYSYSELYNQKLITQYIQNAINMDGEEQKDEYVSLLGCFPWEEQIYIDIYRKYGDENEELLKYSEFFCVPYIKNYKQELIRREKETEERKKREAVAAEKKKKKEQDRVLEEMKAINYRKDLEALLVTNKFPLTIDEQEEINRIENQKKQYLDDIDNIQKEIDNKSGSLEGVCEKTEELQSQLASAGTFAFSEKGRLKKSIKQYKISEQEIKTSISELNKNVEIRKKQIEQLGEHEKEYKNRLIDRKREKIIKELDKIYNQKAPYMKIMDNEISFGRNMRWQIIDRCGSKLLLITKTVDVQKKYNEEETEVNWSNCSLRKWLNGEFKRDNFSEVEKQMMVGFKKGNIQDSIFVLSEDEAKEYFPTREKRACGLYGNPYQQSEFTRNCESWWLRSNEKSNKTPTVSNYGDIGCWSVANRNTYVRPVVNIDMSKLFNEKEIRKKYTELESAGLI